MSNNFFLTCLISLSFFFSSHTFGQSKVDISLQKEIEHSIINGLKWLYEQQEVNGSWNNYPAITALVLSSFLRAHPNFGVDNPVIAKGFDFLKSCVQPDGGIYLDDLKSYNTSICIMAFEDANLLEFQDIILNAKKFLLSLQFDERNGFTPDSIFYGGISYGKYDKSPDLSNLQWALEALYDKEYPIIENNLNQDDSFEKNKTLFLKKAIKFLERTQNLKQVNDQPYSENDGGFMYRPGESKAGETKSYGGMTYAGLKSYIYARLSKNDIRVTAAFNWIKNNFSVTENPGLGLQGLFYYYHTMAKALNIYGEEIIVDNNNIKHKWRDELADQLIKTQSSAGFWVNSNARWWENNPVLVTAYCILALEEILNNY